MPLTAANTIQWISLDEVQPWAGEYVAANRSASAAVQRAYKQRKLSCVVSDEEYIAGGICKDVLTAYKAAAIYDAVTRAPSTFVLWCDFDVVFQRPLDLVSHAATTTMAVPSGASPHDM